MKNHHYWGEKKKPDALLVHQQWLKNFPKEHFWEQVIILRASLVAQMIKNLPAMQEIQVWSLSWEDPLEKGMATHSSITARRIPWTEEAGWLQSMELQRVKHNHASNCTATILSSSQGPKLKDSKTSQGTLHATRREQLKPFSVLSKGNACSGLPQADSSLWLFKETDDAKSTFTPFC